MPIDEIRELANRFSAEQLEQCLQAEISIGENPCLPKGSREEIVRELAEAEFVRKQVEEGVTTQDAIRELARRIRAVQKGSTKPQ